MKSKGLTYIELILVIGIMLTLSILTASFYARFITQNATANTTDRIVGAFTKAQMYAMMGKNNSNWGVNFGSATVTMYQGNSFGTRNSALDESFSVNSNVAISGFSDINYARATGLPSVAATISIQGGNNSDTVTVNSQGVASK
ncbi:hypothetical protein A2803_01710 [Candidatus Woesebacteria bacterium RIFCSPHIGHO2_01_FULL_44_21]|uniref:Prepilin-type N-terminal cleavage/methylation domain-containing protein n=1 Tax=Candidatus Woesebacteria bacterium RIFCSPHIGHO2_01_FULL_44_21 TaxID=1802503 RepID=A0A1F7YV22_9BACT|nr:MAG: hypothetical protein A2803_01710 [Candidatus Woesebacteria bacterium RIFCSPHIGHO2_01_FULL_44_21]OGM69589.1 MAG: hypothetical protein A2897_03225 [Candidatus Woesebacteria bacterium RIFCSPLOWO2_01_FULL_44_24b]